MLSAPHGLPTDYQEIKKTYKNGLKFYETIIILAPTMLDFCLLTNETVMSWYEQ